MALTALLDTNVRIALAWPDHIRDETARCWSLGQRTGGWATCAPSEAGFVRVSWNPAAIRHTVRPAGAVALLRRLRLEARAFRLLDCSVFELLAAIPPRLPGYRQVMDALPLAAAIRHGGSMAAIHPGLVECRLPECQERSRRASRRPVSLDLPETRTPVNRLRS